MGWWRQGEDLLGDGPVDIWEEALEEWCVNRKKPTWQEFADAVAAALSKVPDGTFGDPAALSGARKLQFEVAPRTELNGAADRADLALQREIIEIITQIAEEYQEHHGRRPTLSEVLGTISFSLGVRPERFLSDGKGTSLSRIRLDSVT